jgi:gluconate kinase
MGVSGCGNSTIGTLLAARLRWEFEDADWFPPTSNIEKMHSSIPSPELRISYNDGDRSWRGRQILLSRTERITRNPPTVAAE